jgi:hypothetical protein
MEIQEQNIHLVVTKPVARFHVWLGKWLGLLMMNAILLGMTGLTVYGLLRYQTRASNLTQEDHRELTEQILVARQHVDPIPFPIDAMAKEQLKLLQARGGAQNEDPQTVLEEIRQRMLFQANAAQRDRPVRWRFNLPKAPSPDYPLFLNYKFDAGFAAGDVITGSFKFGTPDRPEEVEIPVEHVAGANYLVIPQKVLREGEQLQVEYSNAPGTSISIQFDPSGGMGLLYYRGSFEGNLLRTLLVMFFQLGFYAAIGLTAGTLFSMPVAAFTSIFFIVMQLFGRFIGEMSKEKVIFGDANKDMSLGMDILNAVVSKVYWLADALLKPLQAFNPFELLASGIQISWTHVALEFLTKLVIYGGLIGGCGILLFNRREIGLPQ